MRPFEVYCRDIYNSDNVQWDHWEENSEGKMEPIHKEGSLRQLLMEFKQDLEEPTRGVSFLQHLFTAYWQYSQFKFCRTNSEEGEVVMVQDFGENRKAALTLGRGTFHDLSLLPHSPQRCYYGYGHGKWEVDGETGVLSQALKRATHQGYNFTGAEDMCKFLSENYGTNKRHYVYSDTIERVDLPDDILVIPDTRKYHQFQTVRPYVVQARRLACFCTACREACFERCVNVDIVGGYTVHRCKPSVDTILNKAFVEPPDKIPTMSNESGNSCLKVGDYVKLTCVIHKATKHFYAVVIDVVNPTRFRVRFLQKRGTIYTFGEQDDEGLITTGPPDFYSRKILDSSEWKMDHQQHYYFSV